MGLLDDAMKQTADTVIGLFTETKAYLLQRTKAYDPVTGADAESERRYPISASPRLSYTTREIDGESVKTGDFKVMVAALGLKVVPKADDLFMRGGKKYDVVTVSPIESGDEVAMYVLQLRS